MTPCLNHLNELVQMRGHNIWFWWEKLSSDTSSYLELCVWDTLVTVRCLIIPMQSHTQQSFTMSKLHIQTYIRLFASSFIWNMPFRKDEIVQLQSWNSQTWLRCLKTRSKWGKFWFLRSCSKAVSYLHSLSHSSYLYISWIKFIFF